MNIYRFGAILNILVVLFLSTIFALMHFYDWVGDFITTNILNNLGIYDFNMKDLLFSTDTSLIYIPSIITSLLGGLFLISGVGPLVVVNRLVHSNSEIGLTYFAFAAIISVPILGGLVMLLGLIGLRPGIYVKRDFQDRETFINEPQNYAYNLNYDRDFSDDYPAKKEKFIEDPNWQPRRGGFNTSLEKRIKDLKRDNVRIEEDAYFTERRQNRRIENLEIDLASERRRNRRRRYY